MKMALFDFQKDALHQLREKLVAARQFATSDNPQALAFSAPTGSGKTVIMTALFEALLDQPDEQLAWPLDWQPQPDAVILWVSDLPELNEQTRLKIESQSDRIYRVHQLIPIDAAFDAEQLPGGRVYFINTQKLGNDKRLTKVGDGRQYSLWTTLSNTAQAHPDCFYVVIDEAHRGMASGRGAKEAQTLMQRFLLGYPEVGLVKMPLVIGVSATPKRFMDLLEHAPHTVHKVAIPPDDVRQSGLLKDRILIHHPNSATTAEMALLEEATRRWAQMTHGWKRYCEAEKEQTVWPALVVQIENGTDQQLTKTSLTDALDVIERALGRPLHEGEAAHALRDAGDLDIGGRKLRKVDASRIAADKNIGVVFFKTSLSTGWDCPRAEVMMSFRRAEDHTYIAQLLGRMMRTPLARRIERDAALNDAHKKAIGKLREQRRTVYEKLRLATAQPQAIPWRLPETIDFRRLPTASLRERHLYVENDGQFRAELGSWEAGVLQEELADASVVGWLRNVDRKPWLLEIPYHTGGAARPMFPDLVMVRQTGADSTVDILEPHDPSLADNFEKATGLARFAEQQGHLFGRIQLIRKQTSPAGGKYFARLEINQTTTIKQLLLITSNPQLDQLFVKLAN